MIRLSILSIWFRYYRFISDTNHQVRRLLLDGMKIAWLGLHSIPSTWMDGHQVVYTNWARPTYVGHGLAYRCYVILGLTGKWTPRSCVHNTGYKVICERRFADNSMTQVGQIVDKNNFDHLRDQLKNTSAYYDAKLSILRAVLDQQVDTLSQTNQNLRATNINQSIEIDNLSRRLSSNENSKLSDFRDILEKSIGHYTVGLTNYVENQLSLIFSSLDSNNETLSTLGQQVDDFYKKVENLSTIADINKNRSDQNLIHIVGEIGRIDEESTNSSRHLSTSVKTMSQALVELLHQQAMARDQVEKDEDRLETISSNLARVDFQLFIGIVVMGTLVLVIILFAIVYAKRNGRLPKVTISELTRYAEAGRHEDDHSDDSPYN